MIEIRNLTKIYPKVDGPLLLLDDITATLPTDRNIGILGRNGSGKSTLLRILASAEAPTAGWVSSDVRLSWPMAFSGGFQARLTAIDNIRFVSRIYGLDWRGVLEQVEEFAELGSFLRMPVSTFSSGMRARLSLALSLAIRFDVYLVDEIPGAGDARFRKRFDAAFDDLNKQSSLILVSHNGDTVRKHCDTFYLLSEGKLNYFDNADEALAAYERE